MTEAWDSAGYIASSRYRLAVCEYLAEHGSGLPSRIAAETELAQPHVSRALSELRERDIVELLVPESQQKGRLYGLTDLGELAYDRVALDQSADVNVVDERDFPARSLIDELRESYRDHLRAVAWCETDEAWVHFFLEELARRYDDETLKTTVSTFTDDEALEVSLGDSPAGEPVYVAIGLQDALVIRVRPVEDVEILVSVDPDFDDPLRGLVSVCQGVVTPAVAESATN